MKLGKEDFQPFLGQVFRCTSAGRKNTGPSIDMRLSEVNEFETRKTKSNVRTEPFSLIFTADASKANFSGRIVHLAFPESATTDEIEIYLEPVSVLDGIAEYEAAFG